MNSIDTLVAENQKKEINHSKTMTNDSFQSQHEISSLISSVERLPERRRTIEEMSVQDWIQKIQRLKNYNTKLESDLERLQEQYDHLFEQKETIRKKAKELTDVVRGIYGKYDELENLVKMKDEEIRKLNHRIEELEVVNAINTKDRRPPLYPTPLDEKFRGSYSNHSNITEETSTATMSVTPEVDDQNTRTIDELNQIINRYQNREKELMEECCKLRARVAELEGTLAGTLYHTAIKGSSSHPPPSTYRAGISNQENKSLMASPERREIESFLDVLKSAAFPTENNTPNRSLNRNPTRDNECINHLSNVN